MEEKELQKQGDEMIKPENNYRDNDNLDVERLRQENQTRVA